MKMPAFLAGLAAFALLGLQAFNSQASQSGVEIHNKAPGEFEVKNTGPDVSLSAQVTLEQLKSGTWIALEDDIRLVTSCKVAPPPEPGCINLHSGQKITPIAWTGLSCSSQCGMACDANVPMGPATFRFTIHSCDGSWSLNGQPFLMPRK